DKKETAQSCSIQLDEQKYSTVAENENCTNYERASAYLGRAGMSFANFLKTGATDNLTNTLGISKLSSPNDYTTGNRDYVTRALCLIGPNTIVTSSRCSGSSRSRSTDEVEISMFANIGDLIYLSYGVLDNDSNGDVTSTEISAFSNTSGVNSSGGGTGLSLYSRFEVVAGSTSYISNDNMSKCVTYTDNYTVDPSSGSDCVLKAFTDGVSITEIRPIFKFDSLTDITGGGLLSSRIDMVSELTSISTALDGDFTSLGISSTNSLRKILSEGLSKLDNGATAKDNATCTAATAFDLLYLLVKNPADNSTSSSDLKSKNLISLTDLITSVDSSLSVVDVANLPMTKARLVYATDSPASTYTDSYEKAESSLYTAMNNIKSIGAESASVKGDGIVTFRELICIGEN
ncbi:MAG: hypothetical protein NZ961_15630, partial [Candidatus Poribacteria bacterium]|nr:hypothetical protein [Candidatus Poribacteria bacterium]